MAGYLGPVGLGVYTFALGLTALLQPFSTFGFRDIATRDIGQQLIDERVVLPNLMYWRIVVGSAAYGVLVVTSAFAGFSDAERRAAIIAGLILVTGALETLQASLEVRLRMGWVSIANAVEAFAFVTGVILLAHAHAGLDTFVWLYVAVNTLNMAIVALIAVVRVRYDWSVRPASCVPLVRAAVPLGLASLFIGFYYRMDIAILARLHPANAVGQYGVGYRFLEAISILPVLFVSVFGPVLARSVRDNEALQRRYEIALHFVVLAAVLISVVGAMTAWRGLTHLPGFSRYHGAGVALAILSPAAGFIFLGTVLSRVILNGHQQKRLLVISGVTLLVNLGLNILLIPPFSYVGASIATTLSELLVVCASVWVIRTHLDLHLSGRRLRGTAALGAVLAVALVPGYLIHPFAQMAIGTVVFLVAVVVSRSVTWADVAGVLSDKGAGRVVITRGLDASSHVLHRATEWASPTDGVVIVGPPSGRVADDGHLPMLAYVDKGIRDLRRSLRGTGRCVVVSDGPDSAFRVCLAARLALCREVVLIVDDDWYVPSRVRHPLVSLLIDDAPSA